MEYIVSFIRDKIVGIPYVILIVVCMFLIFAIIGYLCDLNYRNSGILKNKADKE